MTARVTASLALLLVACGGEDAPPPQPYPFTVTVTSDGEPLENASVFYNDTRAGETNAEGLLTTQLHGPEGQPVAFRVSCPEGYRSPENAQQVTLRRVLSLDVQVQARGVELTFECPPEYRDAVVIVRTHDQTDLPVLVDGVEVGRTDASGTAHIHRRMSPRARFEVRVATASNERLRPVNPAQSFVVPDRDEVFVFDQEFEEERPRRRRRRRRPQPTRPRLPIRIGGPR